MAPRAVLLLLAGVAVAAFLPNAAESRILLTLDDFGAVGDGVADDTKAFAEAWTAACAAADNVILNVPAGKTFQIWPATFSGPCRNEIKLLISGDIVAPESPEDWGKDQSQWLHFSKVEDLTVTGGGIIDGRGQQWWAQASCKEKLHREHDHDKKCALLCSACVLFLQRCATQPAPKAVHFEDCKGISVRGITLQNSPQYHLTFTRSSNIEANYLRVTSPADSPDTVGVHLVDSYNVHVMDDLISTGDDCVSIVGNCTDVRLRAISCGPGHGISIGTLGENNSTDYVEKIKVDTLFISDAENGVRVRTTKKGGGGFARKVKFESIVMRNVTNPIIIDQGRSDHHLSDSSSDRNATEAEGPRGVLVEDINYIDIRGTSASKHAVTFSCSDAVPCHHLKMKNVNLTRVGGHKVKAYCRKAFGKSIGTVVPESCLAEEDFVREVQTGPSEEDGDEEY
ncbi:hypothetical protein PR202_ga05831 [Eleusine coracana subsp. coracana]|uniref:Polygalacturonase n=1 Tax=Eleusine coracana subsp. coracana TaxID=191504 RepID=A0AAV5BTF5_ELECO|nr:hypothetical protein PR202_ga05831 [Eleusine coracana subsp. coracana]